MTTSRTSRPNRPQPAPARQPARGERRFASRPYGRNILIAGPSRSGKSTLAASLIERLIENDYQVCIVDPEGQAREVPAVLASVELGVIRILGRKGSRSAVKLM